MDIINALSVFIPSYAIQERKFFFSVNIAVSDLWLVYIITNAS